MIKPLFQISIAGILLLSACGDATEVKNMNTETKIDVPIIPVEDFFKNPEMSSFQISPDGKHYSYTAPWENRMNIFVKQVGSDKATRITEQTDRDISGYFWGNDNRIVYLKDDNGDENFYLVAVDANGENLIPLTREAGVRTQIIDDLEDDKDFMIVGLNKRNPQIFDAYRLNINTGEMEMIAENPGNITGWMTDHDGKMRVAITSDGVNTSVLYRATEDAEFKSVLTTNFKETMSPQFFTFDNKKLYASSNIGRDKAAIVVFDPETGKEEKVLFEDNEFDVDGLNYSRKDKKLIAATYTGIKQERHFFDDEYKAIFTKLEKQFPEMEIFMTSSTDAEDKFIIRTYGDKSLGEYYLYDRTSGEVTDIANPSPWINEENMASMHPISYQSRDGLTIHGYLTLPVGYTMDSAKNLPVVVNPHGGPWARDSWGFNPEVQFLANRGYAVLQMNFRGSVGYGRDFWEASFREWGKKMQDDITDGVNWIVEKGIGDKDRIAIYGASYGGYATLAGMAFTPDLYACGIDYVGVSNLFSFMGTIPPYWEPYKKMMYEMVGNPEEAADSIMLKEASPVFHADKIVKPLFVAQGAQDPRVNKDESDQMVAAMKARGVEVEYMVKDNEGHGFHNEENRFEFYRAMEAFLAKYIAE
ncbi:S9 family peptidase [Cryomorpha ignava]|uniref:S9 family peptidase n=1 Tax=Cryomorpha ignava TaxID=101383 RepID=A0A7K3WSN6_9FLAO|nr:S9 family peptidase [Cryomorpha ignava]NEN24703.1 S9 family peptidase [Cryomorpha ignava]